MTDLQMKVYNIARKIPFGKVMTYGDIAKSLGNKNLSRMVGNTLHKNPCQKEIPCHRIVNGKGKLSTNFAFGGIDAQKALLEKENIIVEDNTVSRKYFYNLNNL